MDKPVVSIFIPAYNTPGYTRKTLQSIVEQTYRPIELIFSDDCSPTPLEPLVDEFRRLESEDFKIHFSRQPINLRGADNMIFCFDRCTGKYIVNMPHDDWWTDRNFLSEAVELMENNHDCYLCVANSILENSDGKKMIKLPTKLNAKESWRIIHGDVYIKLLGIDRIGVQAWSGIIFNLPLARDLGVFHYPFNLTKEQADSLDIISDEFFACQFLLSSIGSVAITEKIVGVRGRPETAVCNVLKEWNYVMGQTGFFILYNIYKANLCGKYSRAVKKRALGTIFQYPVEKINIKIIHHYDSKPDVILFMAVSYIFHLLKRPMYFVKLFRKLLYRLANEQPTEVLNDLSSKLKQPGLIRILFPPKT
jgi:glycosyltransferase involved in cell wall biosynthesis